MSIGVHSALDPQDAHKASEMTEMTRTDEQWSALDFPVDGAVVHY